MTPEGHEGNQDKLSAKDSVEPSLQGWLRRYWRNMPREALALLVAVLLFICLGFLGSSHATVSLMPRPMPAQTPTFSAMPFPISISLPGGWVFPLGCDLGGCDNRPKYVPPQEGACRSISLPYTVQLEAVVRSLQSTDEIKLSMSNYDSLVYKVQSVEQVPSPDITKLATDNYPCLLVVLSRSNTNSVWVVTAKP